MAIKYENLILGHALHKTGPLTEPQLLELYANTEDPKWQP